LLDIVYQILSRLSSCVMPIGYKCNRLCLVTHIDVNTSHVTVSASVAMVNIKTNSHWLLY